MRDHVDLAPFEGLIFTTAARYAPILDEDLDDIRQILRLKVWQALTRFDGSRSTKGVESYVFSCLRNRVKDLLKEQHRLNERRKGGPLHIEDLTDDLGRFEGRYLAAEDPDVFDLIEQSVELPSCLDETERALVLVLLEGDFTRAEIALRIGVSRKRVVVIHRAVQEKLADFAPDGFVFSSCSEGRVQSSTDHSDQLPAHEPEPRMSLRSLVAA